MSLALFHRGILAFLRPGPARSGFRMAMLRSLAKDRRSKKGVGVPTSKVRQKADKMDVAHWKGIGQPTVAAREPSEDIGCRLQ